MKRVLTKCLLVAVFALFAWTRIVPLAYAFDMNATLSIISVIEKARDVCDIPENERFAQLKELIFNHLLDLGARYSGLGSEEAQEELDRLLQVRADRNFGNGESYDCASFEHDRIGQAYRLLASGDVLGEVQNLAELDYPWHERRELPYSSTGATSYIYNNLQPVFHGTILGHLERSGTTCTQGQGLDVLEVGVVSVEPMQTQNLPFFIDVPNQYVEDWSVTCAGPARVFRMTFQQSSNGPIGNYVVREVTSD